MNEVQGMHKRVLAMLAVSPPAVARIASRSNPRNKLPEGSYLHNKKKAINSNKNSVTQKATLNKLLMIILN